LRTLMGLCANNAKTTEPALEDFAWSEEPVN